MLFVAFLSRGVWREWNLFNQQLPLTVPQLGTSCRFNSQVVPPREANLIEIQASVSRSSSQPGTALEKLMKPNQPDCVLNLRLMLLDCALVAKLFEEPLLSEQMNLEWCLSDDCSGLPVLLLKTSMLTSAHSGTLETVFSISINCDYLSWDMWKCQILHILIFHLT